MTKTVAAKTKTTAKKPKSKKKPAKSTGRPKSKLDGLPKDWMRQVIGQYAIGAADVEIKALIYEWRGTFSNDLWDRWMKEEPIFSETIKSGRMLAEAWWQGTGRKSLKDKEFSFTGWYMQMKNRFGWKDKSEVDNKHSGEVTFTNDVPRPKRK